MAAVAAAAMLLPVPYVVLHPGPTANTLGEVDGKPLIRVEGRPTYPTSGRLDLTTIGYAGSPDGGVHLFAALAGWLDPRSAVVPREHVFPAGISSEQARQREADFMLLSQQDATTAAMRALNVPVAGVVVRSVLDDAPAQGVLRVGDEVQRVDGTPIHTVQDLRDAVSARRPGEELVVRVRRDGRELTPRIRAVETTDAGGARRTVIGVVPEERYPFTVDIGLSDDVGGPSAGLMFALGIIDKLTPGALTGGARVAGTGTIDPDGRVGRIGGIQQKLLGARTAGATVFLIPEENCPAALPAVPDGLRLVKVATLTQARAALEALSSGRDAPSCA